MIGRSGSRIGSSRPSLTLLNGGTLVLMLRSAHSRPPCTSVQCATPACRPRSIARGRALRASLGFASAPALTLGLLVLPCSAQRQRVGLARSRGDARCAPPSASPRPPRSLSASLYFRAVRNASVSASLDRAGTRAARLPRLRLGPRAHSRPPCTSVQCATPACRPRSIARGRALRASLGFASAPALTRPGDSRPSRS